MITVLATGGTIAMTGAGGAVPSLDADALVTGLDVRARTIAAKPGAQLTLADALEIARAARAEAESGHGVVVTHGTDTLEETAYLCDLLYAGAAPIVFTGAIRPASAPGADGPANLRDAVAAASAATDLGVLVCFGGELHAARDARKADSTSPLAFRSPRLGPLGSVHEGRVELARRVDRRPPLDPGALDARVDVVGAFLGSGGFETDGLDGLVAVVLGAGHVPPPFLDALRAAARRIPVVCTVRPERGAILHRTYGFEGSERDLRAAGVVCAAALSPAHARIKLLACLGAGADVAEAFAPDDV